MTKNFSITLSEYDRIFRIIHSVSEKLDDRAGASCLFYNTVGALLIEKFLKVKAKPVAGGAFFRVDDATDTVLSFIVADESGALASDTAGFHCWVETEDHVIDFTAPVYQKYFDKMGSSIKMPSKMFQKRKSEMASSYQELYREGDYFVQGNEALTKHLFSQVYVSPAIGDLANVCCHWFKRPPQKIEKTMKIQNDLGEVIDINLTAMPISGAW